MLEVIMGSTTAGREKDAVAWLHEQGLRATTSRIAIVRLLYATEVPLTLAEIQERLARTSCDFATVFRFISLLEEKGLVERVAWVDGTTRHEIRDRDGKHQHHHYLICRTCHKIEPLEKCVVENFETQIARERGYASVSHSLQLSGVCPSCQNPPARPTRVRAKS